MKRGREWPIFKKTQSIPFFRLDKDKATMLRVMRQFFSLPPSDFSDEEILHICGILYVNSHEVPVTANPVQVSNPLAVINSTWTYLVDEVVSFCVCEMPKQ